MRQKIEYYVIKDSPVTESLKKIESSKHMFNESDKVFKEWQSNFKKAVESGDIRCDKTVYEAMFASGYSATEDAEIDLPEEQDYMVLVKEALDEGFLEYRFRDEYQAYGTFDAAAKASKPAALLDKTEDGWRILAKTPQAEDYTDELNEQVSLIVIE